MNEIIAWLESDEGRKWSISKHRRADGHEPGFFGCIKIESHYWLDGPYSPDWYRADIPLKVVGETSPVLVEVDPAISDLASPA